MKVKKEQGQRIPYLRAVRFEQGKVDDDELHSHFLVLGGQDNLRQSADCVVLGSLAHVGPEHEVLDLLGHDELHERVVGQEQDEEVGRAARDPPRGVAELVDERCEQRLEEFE